MAEFVLMMERIRSRLVTTGLIVAASLKIQATVDVLSLPVRGAYHAEDLYTLGKVASCRTSAANSRSELVIRPVGLSKLTRFAYREAIGGAKHGGCRLHWDPTRRHLLLSLMRRYTLGR